MQKKTRNYLGRNFSKRRRKDILSKKARSILMSKIHSRGTKFESDYIKSLKMQAQAGFKTNVLSLRGRPDIVFQKQRICVFLDSDFWHGWQYPRWKHLLKNDFWRVKIEANRRRDRRTTQYLRVNGWQVFRIWEHDIKKDLNKSISRISEVLKALQ